MVIPILLILIVKNLDRERIDHLQDTKILNITVINVVV
jgi:hypothetical protein